jgi:hypothetical protein
MLNNRCMLLYGLQTLVPDRPDGGLPRRVTLRLKKFREMSEKATSASTTGTSSSTSTSTSSISVQSSTSQGGFVFQAALTVQLNGSQPVAAGVNSSACSAISKFLF